MRVDEVFNHDFDIKRRTKISESIEEVLTEAPEDRKGGVEFEKKLEKFILKRGIETGTTPSIWQAPAASDAVWPDLGVTIALPSGKVVHLHIEAKSAVRDPMGSLRSWIFDGQKFRVDPKDGAPIAGGTVIMLSVMNNSKELKANAKKVLQLLKKHFHPGIKELSSGSMNIVPDKTDRLKQAIRFTKELKKAFPGTGKEGASGFQLGKKIKGGDIGDLILSHYKKKFKNRSGGANIMMFAIGPNSLAYMPTTKPSKIVQKELAEFLGVDAIPFLPKGLEGSIEARGQVRGLSQIREEGGKLKQPPKGFVAKKRVFIDVQANLRFTGLQKIRGSKF